jgi:hypothetical protein
MEMNSHQKVLHSIAVPKRPPSQAARFQERQLSICAANRNMASSCIHHTGRPCARPNSNGQAMLAACRQPAIKTMMSWNGEKPLRGGRLRACSSKAGKVGRWDIML